MATHPQVSVQQKVYTVLTGDATLMGLIEGVYDNVPDNPLAPYVTIGDDEYSDFSSHTHDGFEGSVQIDVWSEAVGRKECKTIQNRIYTLLQNLDLAIDGFPTLNFKCGLSTVEMDPDGRTYHGVQRFDFLIGGN